MMNDLTELTQIEEVSDEENEEILRAIEALTDDDLRIVRSDVIFL